MVSKDGSQQATDKATTREKNKNIIKKSSKRTNITNTNKTCKQITTTTKISKT